MTSPPRLRAFQEDVLELARERNVVMVGDTGIGKTFVAIALLSEQDYSEGMRAFFLAPTRQLVWQITAKIRATTTLRANAYCGQSMELWGEREWAQELMLTRVFVCTPEVLRNALERGFVRMERINLLVFDECHHVSKRHPYAQVIKLYDPQRMHEMPRVFGTTACPTRDCAKNLHAEIKKVELDRQETVAYAAVAPILFEMYDKQAPRAPMMDESEIFAGLTDADDEVTKWMVPMLRFAGQQELLDVLQEIKAVPVLKKLLTKGRSIAARDDERLQKVLRRFVLSCVEVYKNLGLWCACKYIELEIDRSAANGSLLMSVPGSMYGYDPAAITSIMMARRKRTECDFAATKRIEKVVELLRNRLLDGDDEQEKDEEEEEKLEEEDATDERDDAVSLAPTMSSTADLEIPVLDFGMGGQKSRLIVSSPKLVNLGMAMAKSQQDKRKMQGIIFVTTRAECRVLCDFLNEKLESCQNERRDSDFDDFDDESSYSSFGDADDENSESEAQFACILGQAATRDTASTNLPRMEETLTKFEQGKIQFLVSTAVSIEGVDFPQCSLIIVADRIQSARKLIQLRGRARHQDGVVYYLAEEGDKPHEMHFKIMLSEADAINALDFRYDKQETVLQQPRSRAAEKLTGLAYFPEEHKVRIESTGAVLDLDSSISRLNMFCQTLPAQLYTVDYKNMYTFSQVEVHRRPLFKCKLQLPVELSIPPFESELFPSKATAKAAAAFEACKHLLENGQLDASLQSVFRKTKNSASDVERLSYFLNRLHH